MVQKLTSFLTSKNKKILVGLTGVFGSGKSTVGHLFEELGACLIEADHLAHEALLEGSPVYSEIVKIFPEAAGPSGLDRKKIAKVVFRDAQKRKALEARVHPFVYQRMGEEAALAEEKVILFEVPLLFESGFEDFWDFSVTVSAPEELRRARLLEKGFPEEEIDARFAAQFSQEEKEKRSDFIVNNSGVLDQTRREVKKIWEKIQPVSKGEK